MTDAEKLNAVTTALRAEFKTAVRNQSIPVLNLAAEMLFIAKFGVSRHDDDLPVSWVQFYDSLRKNAENEIAADRLRAETANY